MLLFPVTCNKGHCVSLVQKLYHGSRMLRPHLEFLRQLRYHFFRLFHCNNHSSFLKTTASPHPAEPNRRRPPSGTDSRTREKTAESQWPNGFYFSIDCPKTQLYLRFFLMLLTGKKEGFSPKKTVGAVPGFSRYGFLDGQP